MFSPEHERLIDSYIASRTLVWAQDSVLRRKEESDWAESALYDAVAESPAMAWELIREIARRSQSFDLLQALANGPLVTLLKDHPESVLAQISAESISDAAAKTVLGHIWEENKFPEPIESIIERACESEK